MRENPEALDKLYSMLHDAESLGLSRPARMRLIGIIGSLENEELDRFRQHFAPERGEEPRAGDDGRRTAGHSSH
jgi:hypothetical protein